jgi:transcription initiation factor IIE alpha subunit
MKKPSKTAVVLSSIQRRAGTIRRLAIRLEVEERELKPILRSLYHQKKIGCDCGKWYWRKSRPIG